MQQFTISISKIRLKNIAFAVASSGIAATLLEGGRLPISHSNVHSKYVLMTSQAFVIFQNKVKQET